jgi:predicted DNA-binding transcriptional regulator AlpA
MQQVLDEDAIANKIVAGVTAALPKRRGVKPGSKRAHRARELSSPLLDDDVLLTTEEACILFGGPSRPIHSATLYRNAGTRYPLPVRIGPGTVRWLRSECMAARQKLIDARTQPMAA